MDNWSFIRMIALIARRASLSARWKRFTPRLTCRQNFKPIPNTTRPKRAESRTLARRRFSRKRIRCPQPKPGRPSWVTDEDRSEKVFGREKGTVGTRAFFFQQMEVTDAECIRAK